MNGGIDMDIHAALEAEYESGRSMFDFVRAQYPEAPDAVPGQSRFNGPFARQRFALTEPGAHCHQHRHNYTHVTVVFSGVIVARGEHEEGRTVERIFRAGDEFVVDAGVEHRFIALEPAVYECWKVHRQNGQVVEEYTGDWDAYN